MNAKKIRDIQRRVPFQPFIIHCNNNQTFRVKHPENIFVLPFTVYFYEPDATEEYSISIRNITSIEVSVPVDTSGEELEG